MKKIIIVILIIVAIGVVAYYQRVKPMPVDDNLPVVIEDSVKGCYVAHLAKDVYSLKISSQNGEMFEGTLVFKNFEKDSSGGTFKGTYKDRTLLGDYTFNSEGMTSVMQVIFKKSGNGFVRGYGDMDKEGTHFADINKITYDSSYIFESSAECATTL